MYLSLYCLIRLFIRLYINVYLCIYVYICIVTYTQYLFIYIYIYRDTYRYICIFAEKGQSGLAAGQVWQHLMQPLFVAQSLVGSVGLLENTTTTSSLADGGAEQHCSTCRGSIKQIYGEGPKAVYMNGLQSSTK